MVVACLALFVALGGVSYGVATGSIDGREIKNNSVASKDLRNNSAGTADIKNGSLLRGDFKSGQLPAGARGPEGPAGVAGRDGFGTLAYPIGVVPDIAPGESGNDILFCPDGTYPTGGDAYTTENEDEDPNAPLVFGVVQEEVFAFDGATPVGWWVYWDNQSGQEVDLFVDVSCANANTVQSKAKAKRQIRKGAGGRLK